MEIKPREAIGITLRINPKDHRKWVKMVEEIFQDLLSSSVFPRGRYEGNMLEEKDTKGKKVLDIGTGTGVVAEVLNKKGGIVTGVDIDISDALVRKEIFKGGLIEEEAISYLERASQEGKKFHLICAFRIFGISILNLARNAAKILEPGGKLILSAGPEKKGEMINVATGEERIKLFKQYKLDLIEEAGKKDYPKYAFLEDIRVFRKIK